MKTLFNRLQKRIWLQYFIFSLLGFLFITPCFITSLPSELVLTRIEPYSQEKSSNRNLDVYERSSICYKSEKSIENDPEAYFPNFLYYSITLGNAIIDYLYDNTNGGFYRASDQYWSNTSIDRTKYVYDQAQAILAMLKLSEAVINQSERDLALTIAESTANFLLTNLYDGVNGGFYLSEWETYKKPGIQGKVIQALLALYDSSNNQTYREFAYETIDFINKYGWDDSNKGYYYLLSHTGIIPEENPFPNDPYGPKSKRVDHNVIMGEALLDLYHHDSDPSYLSKASDIYQMINTTCRNQTTKLFYTGCERNSTIIDPYKADVFINSLVLEFLAKLYNTTQDENYYRDFFILTNALLYNFWDEMNGGFFATYSYLGGMGVDTKKYAERQFYAIRALDEAYQLSENNLYYNLILDMMEFVNTHLYDNMNEGFYQLTNEDGRPGGDDSWNDKFCVVQALAIYELANLWLYSKPGVLNALWSPSTPRPEDSVTILVAAFDADGIADVLLNYSLNDEPYTLEEMVPHHLIGNMYNYSFEPQAVDTTINFNIIVNDTLGNNVVRGNYFFFWQYDVWGPHVEIVGIDPGTEVPVHTRFSLVVSAHDIPSQGEVLNVRMYYHASNQRENSRRMDNLDSHLWFLEFPDGFETVSSYTCYFEAMDNHGNIGHSDSYFFRVLGHLETISLPFIIGTLFFLLVIVPTGLYTYVEYKRKGARKTLKMIRAERSQKRRRRRRRGTRRIKNTLEK
jgi:mannose/cellobiose epimerase-like protein (N-acyl-D-glucosamine 2-epimerase family)